MYVKGKNGDYMQNILNKIKSNKDIVIIFLVTLFLGLLICGPFFRYHLASDNYVWIERGTNVTWDSGSARQLSDMFLYYMDVVGINAVKYQLFFNICSVIIMAIASTMLYSISVELIEKKSKKISLAILFGAIFIIFNIYGFEMFLFNVMGSLSIQYLVTVITVKKLVKKIDFITILECIFLNLIGLCIYQAINPIFLGLAIILLGYKYKDEGILKNIKNYFIVGVVYGVSCVANVLIMKLSSIPRYGETNILENIKKLISRQELIWIDTFDLLPKYLYIGIIILLLVIGFFKVCANYKKKTLKIMLSIFLAIFMTIFAAYLPHIASDTVFVPRTGLSVSCIVGYMLLFIGIYFPKERELFNLFIKVISGVYLFFTVYVSCKLVQNTIRTNNYDKDIARQILEVVEEYEKKENIKVENMSFTLDEKPTWRYKDIHGKSTLDPYVRAFTIPWSRNLIIETWYNRRFNEIEMPDEIYNEYFKGKNWDKFNTDQIVIKDNTAYVAVY